MGDAEGIDRARADYDTQVTAAAESMWEAWSYETPT